MSTETTTTVSGSNMNILLTRVALGVVILVHGVGKLLGMGPAATGPGIPGFEGFLVSLGVPSPLVFAWIVALVETLGGLAILLGFLTRLAAILIAVDMATAAYLVHLPNGFVATDGGYELVLVLFILSLSLLISGDGGRLSLERMVFGREILPDPRQLRGKAT